MSAAHKVVEQESVAEHIAAADFTQQAALGGVVEEVDEVGGMALFCCK
jgi:hypothetical protein